MRWCRLRGDVHEDVANYNPHDILGSFNYLHDKYRLFTMEVVGRKIGYQGAEDVVQELWFNIYGKMMNGSLVPNGSMKGFLCVSANNLATDYLKKFKVQSVDDTNILDRLRADTMEPLEDLLSHQDLVAIGRIVNQAWNAIPPMYQRTLALRQDGISYAEIARMGGINASNARVRYHHGKELLRGEIRVVLQERRKSSAQPVPV